MREFVVAKRLREDEADRDVALAWRTAALMRQKRLPSLKSLLIAPKKQKQTIEEQRAALEVLSQQFGGAIRKGRKGMIRG